VQLVPRVRKAQEVILALKAKMGQQVILVFKALLALRVRQEPKEFKVTLALMVKRVTPVLLGKQERKVILVKKVPQGRKVNRVSLELLGKTV
jgi:hypothetical protein